MSGHPRELWGFMLMRIFWKWSHWSCVWSQTALLCSSEAICSPYSSISVVRDVKGKGKLECCSLIRSDTTLHFMAHQPEIPSRDISVTLELYDSFCLLLSCCFSSHSHSYCHFPANWCHLSSSLPLLGQLFYKDLFFFVIWNMNIRMRSFILGIPLICRLNWFGLQIFCTLILLANGNS